jgi:hypothetical protein
LLSTTRYAGPHGQAVSIPPYTREKVTEKNTPEIALRVRILSLPAAGEFDEFDLRHYHVGDVYELPLRLATLLVIGGYAESAGRAQSIAADFGRPRSPKTK